MNILDFNNRIGDARTWTLELHATQTYGKGNHIRPYFYHLEAVANRVSTRFYFWIHYAGVEYPDYYDQYFWCDLICAAWLHDAMEDRGVSYNEIKNRFNVRVADLVYGVTTEKGRNRDERANDDYYCTMRSIRGASFLKICDRYCNVSEGILTGHSMLARYAEELPSFRDKIGVTQWDLMNEFGELEALFATRKAS